MTGRTDPRTVAGGTDGYRSGFAALIGRPNVGKSTLLNRLIGTKVAITSDKPQTTRNRIAGVLTDEASRTQLVFLDTPGLHRAKHRLGDYMVKLARATLNEVDMIMFLVEATGPPGDSDAWVAGQIAASRTPAVLVVNKIDAVSRDTLIERLAAYSELGDFAAVIPVSALTGENTERLLDWLRERLEPGPLYYPPDQVSDQPEHQLIAEIVREKILHLTRDEVPHAVAVQVEQLAARPGGKLYCACTIYIERESQKGIIIGKGGRMLKQIGSLAREELEPLLGQPLFLELWVKVREDWRNRPRLLEGLGYRDE